MPEIPQDIQDYLAKRNNLRVQKRFEEADIIRMVLEEKGYKIVDTKDGSTVVMIGADEKQTSNKAGKIALFGSGEISPTGRRVHEYLVKDFVPPVSIALLETPAGFEDNPHVWYKKLAAMMQIGLQNAQPVITRIEALDNSHKNGTNDPVIVDPLLKADYIHTGAGSPTYATRMLKDSVVYHHINEQVKRGKSLSFASAAAIALGRYVIPVYELYKAGIDVHWQDGLDFFSQYGLNITIVPHWNNTEGGEEIDTSRCYMGKRRFQRLVSLLPDKETIIVGIDEQTACIFDLDSHEINIMGNGKVTITKNLQETVYNNDTSLPFKVFK